MVLNYNILHLDLIAKCRATVPPDVAIQYFTLWYSAKAFSNLRIYAPWLEIQLVSTHSDTYLCAFLLRYGTNMGIIQKIC